MINIKNNKGFIVLIAVMVTTIILTVGIGVLNLALREFILANVGRDSVKAFYAADTGVDCAFNYDILSADEPAKPYFASPLPIFSESGSGYNNPGEGDNEKTNIECNKQDLNVAGVYNTSSMCNDSDGVPRSCKITTLARNSDFTDIPKSALCLESLVSGSCVGACVTIQVKKIQLTNDTQETQIIANGISDCQGERSVERSLLLTWGANNP